MTYATEQDLIDRFGEHELIELSDRADPPSGLVDSSVVAKALEDADALINAYVGKRYRLPLAAVPGQLARVAGDIARYYLHKDQPTETVQRAYDAALRFLRDVSGGAAVLDAAGVEPTAAENTVQVASRTRVFDRGSLEGF